MKEIAVLTISHEWILWREWKELSYHYYEFRVRTTNTKKNLNHTTDFHAIICKIFRIVKRRVLAPKNCVFRYAQPYTTHCSQFYRNLRIVSCVWASLHSNTQHSRSNRLKEQKGDAVGLAEGGGEQGRWPSRLMVLTRILFVLFLLLKPTKISSWLTYGNFI